MTDTSFLNKNTTMLTILMHNYGRRIMTSLSNIRQKRCKLSVRVCVIQEGHLTTLDQYDHLG